MPSSLGFGCSLLSFYTPLRLFFLDPGLPGFSRSRVLAAEGNRDNVGILDHSFIRLAFGEHLQKWTGAGRGTVEEIPLDRGAGGQRQRYITPIIKGLLDRFGQLFGIGRAEDPSLEALCLGPMLLGVSHARRRLYGVCGRGP